MAKEVISAVPVVTIRDAKEMARAYMKANVPFFFHGAPGLGKSDAVRQLAAEQNIGFLDIRLAMMDPVDLLGLPVVSNGRTTWATPAFWPDVKRDGERGLIIFDELSDAGRSLQSAAYQIILNRRVGPHILPEGWFPCAAGNRREDKAAAQSISSALGNRFAHISIQADYDSWREWANANYISPTIIAFLKVRGNLLHNMEGGDLLAFPTPRSWAQASKVVEADIGMRQRLLSGLVGAGVAGEFEAFMKALDLPDLEEIIKTPKKCRIPKEPSSKYALAAMLAQHADKKNWGAICEYTKRSEYGRDFEILSVLDATKKDSSLTETAAFADFASRNGDLNL